MTIAAAASLSGELVDRIAATVNDTAIPESEVRKAMLVSALQPEPGESPEAFRGRVLDALIDQQLEYQDAARFGPAPPDAAQLSEAMKKLQDRLKAEGRDPVAEFARAGLTEDDVLSSLERQLVIQRYLRERFAPIAYADEEQARAEYSTHYVPEQEAARQPVRAVREGRRRDAPPRLRAGVRRPGLPLDEGAPPEGADRHLPDPAAASGRAHARPRLDGAARRPHARALSVLAAILAALLAGTAPSGPPGADLRGVAVPMRDGVKLSADVLRPKAEGRFPTLVYRTPYDRKRASEDEVATAALQAGYAVVRVDVRGRYDSAGVFTPYRNEGADGYDTIEWAAAQPWSTGDIGTYGLSYPGAVQWLAAVESPPHLKAMVPAMTFSTPRNFFYAGGAWDLSWLPWIWNNIAPDARVRANLPGPRTGREARAEWKRLQRELPYRLPVTDVPELRGAAPFYFDWLAHRPGESWWDWSEIRGRYGRVGAAVLNISGWHDEAYGPEGAMTNFLGLLEARRGEADPRAQVILGPWVHGGEGEDRSGDRVFGPQARLAYAQEIVRFMDRYVRGLENGVERAPRVRAFVMGENVWRTGNTLPLEGTQPVSLYLTGGGKLAREAPAGERRRRAASSRIRRIPSSIPTPMPPGHTTTARSPGAPTRWCSRPSLSRSRSASSARSRRRSTFRPTLRTPTSGSSSRTSARTERPGTCRAPARTCCGSASGTAAPSAKRAGGGRDRRPAPAEPAHREPLREGPSRARRALRKLHAALLAQPPDRRVRDALREDAQGARSASTTTLRTPPASSSPWWGQP